MKLETGFRQQAPMKMYREQLSREQSSGRLGDDGDDGDDADDGDLKKQACLVVFLYNDYNQI